MNATLLDLEHGEGRAVALSEPDKYRDMVTAPIITARQVVFARRDEPEPGESPFCAFWSLTDDADSQHEYDKVFGGMSKNERLIAVIFQGADLEPELKTELVVLDGVSVLRIELDPHLPHHVLLVPERFIP